MLLVSLCACVQRGTQQKSVPVKRSFPTVSLPAMVQDPQEAAEYMAMHYWDAFLKPQDKEYVSDSLYVSGVSVADLEQALANGMNEAAELLEEARQKAAFPAIKEHPLPQFGLKPQ